MLTTGSQLSSVDGPDLRKEKHLFFKNVRLEPGGGPGDGADGRHHPRHPRQHLPRAQRAEQVRGLPKVELGDNCVLFTGVPPSSSWRTYNMAMIQTSRILYFVIISCLACPPV